MFFRFSYPNISVSHEISNPSLHAAVFSCLDRALCPRAWMAVTVIAVQWLLVSCGHQMYQ